jgi:hypothetical protein
VPATESLTPTAPLPGHPAARSVRVRFFPGPASCRVQPSRSPNRASRKARVAFWSLRLDPIRAKAHRHAHARGPALCPMIGIVFKQAAASLGQDQHAVARGPRPLFYAIEHVAAIMKSECFKPTGLRDNPRLASPLPPESQACLNQVVAGGMLDWCLKERREW